MYQHIKDFLLFFWRVFLDETFAMAETLTQL